jgi:peptide/nickel transport system permease protein
VRRLEHSNGRPVSPRLGTNGRVSAAVVPADVVVGGGRRWLGVARSRGRRPMAVSPMAVAGLTVIGVVVLFCFAGPLFYRPDLVHVNLGLSNRAPSGQHLLGTDAYGVDVLGKLMTGGQVSLEVGIASGLLAVVIGSLWGAVAGYLGGAVDAAMMRLVDAGIAIPVIVLLLLLTSIYQPNTVVLILVIAATSWLSTARLVRGAALTLRGREFVQAMRGMGGGRARAILRHIAPNALSTITVNVTFQIADAILVLATLSYLGLGVQPPSSDWGDMIAAGVQSIYAGYWWEIYPAGIAIIAVVVGFNLLGDGLRDQFDAASRW